MTRNCIKMKNKIIRMRNAWLKAAHHLGNLLRSFQIYTIELLENKHMFCQNLSCLPHFRLWTSSGWNFIIDLHNSLHSKPALMKVLYMLFECKCSMKSNTYTYEKVSQRDKVQLLQIRLSSFIRFVSEFTGRMTRYGLLMSDGRKEHQLLSVHY